MKNENSKTLLLRNRKTHFPKTYVLLRKGGEYFLLFWLEYGKDNSIYVWFGDSPNNEWQVTTRYSQQEQVRGVQEINLQQEQRRVFDPHISWHPSGEIHVKCYNESGEENEPLISKKETDSWADVVLKQLTVPVTQLVFPTSSPSNLIQLGEGLLNLLDELTTVGVIDTGGFRSIRNGAPNQAFLIIDRGIVPDGYELGIDLQVHYKNDNALPQGKMPDLIFDKNLSLHKEKTSSAVCFRIFKVKNNAIDGEISSIVATCFNKTSLEIFQLKRNPIKIKN